MNTSKIKFLVPIDFSKQSIITLEETCKLAKKYEALIYLLYIVETNALLPFLPKKKLEESVKNQITDKLQELAIKYEKAYNNTLEVLPIEEGRVYDKIVKKGEELNVNLVCMGTSGVRGIKKLMGTNTIRVVKQSKKPVLTIAGKTQTHGCKNILLPIDLTKNTNQKVADAVELARLFNGATIHMVSVIWDVNDQVVNGLIKNIEEAKHAVESHGVNCTAEMVKIVKGIGSFGTAILDYSEKVNANLILIMTQQEKNSTPFFIGSAAQTIINKATVPVISIVPKQ